MRFVHLRTSMRSYDARNAAVYKAIAGNSLSRKLRIPQGLTA